MPPRKENTDHMKKSGIGKDKKKKINIIIKTL